jgi:CubicO group peptidase (beta-lactamase class C family)
MQKAIIIFFLFHLTLRCFAQSNLYFPPNAGTTWETIPAAQLGFCPERIDSLYRFLEVHNTKGFLLLQDGKIVLEKYFAPFKQDSNWYWASAGKSLSAYLMGIAIEKNGVKLNAPVATYLGNAWSSVPPNKQSLIEVRHLLSMTTGLDDAVVVPGVPDPDNCTQPQCLTYKTDAGTRWAYHNAPYKLTHAVIEAASGQNINQFTRTQIFDRIGASGFWFNGIMFSTPRTMARFGLLSLANGIWKSDTILRDQAYVQAMSRPTQSINNSYGYLWWLNGQPSFMLPSLQLTIPGQLFSNAPPDTYSALGKNDQKIHVVPSKRWVVVRMGDDGGYVGPGGGSVPIYFDQDMWAYLNKLTCASDTKPDAQAVEPITSPNPSLFRWNLKHDAPNQTAWRLYDTMGMLIDTGATDGIDLAIDAQRLPNGMYLLLIGDRAIKLIRG